MQAYTKINANSNFHTDTQVGPFCGQWMAAASYGNELAVKPWADSVLDGGPNEMGEWICFGLE